MFFKLVFADLQVPVGIETRRGYDWSERYPLINQAALGLRRSSFVIDGEAVVLGPDGISDFDALHTGKRNAEVRLSARDSPPEEAIRKTVLPIRSKDTGEKPAKKAKIR